MFFKAAENGDLETLREMISQGQDVDATESNGRTALHIASVYGRLDCVRLLVENRANIHQVSGSCSIAMHFSAIKGHLDVLRYFIEEVGLSVDIKPEGYDETALHEAVRGKRFECADYLIGKGANLRAVDSIGYTPISIAARDNHIEMIEFLCGYGENIHSHDCIGNTLLHTAAAGGSARRGNLECVRYLLENDVDPYALNNVGKTAAECAKENNAEKAVEAIESFVKAKREQASLDARIAVSTDYAEEDFDI